MSRKREDGVASLSGATGTGRGAAVACHGTAAVAVWINVNGLTTSTTVEVQGSMQSGVGDDELWVTLAAINATADGTWEVLVEDPPHYVCADVTAFTDGGTINADVCKIRES
jgi:hypothetical protein